jgi:hypothetical protein
MGPFANDISQSWTVKQEATMYYEYFRERASLYRRSANGANAWLADVSMDLADMFDEMAKDALTRELSFQSGAATVAAGPKAYRPTQPAAVMVLGPRVPWWRIGCDRWRDRGLFTRRTRRMHLNGSAQDSTFGAYLRLSHDICRGGPGVALGGYADIFGGEQRLDGGPTGKPDVHAGTFTATKPR